MRKLLLLALFSFTLNAVSAQCVIDSSVTSPGIYPDSATNFAISFVGTPYEQHITAVTPPDTLVEIFPGNWQTVPIDSIVIDNISGLPPNFTYDCQTPNCAFYGGTTMCARVFSTSNPTIADTGRYWLTIDLTAYSFISQQSQILYYYIDVVDSAQASVPDFEGERIRMDQNQPNPVIDITTINYVSGTNTDVTFAVTNLLGQTVHREERFARRGENKIVFDASYLKPGVYMYSIDNGNVVYSKKMVVK